MKLHLPHKLLIAVLSACSFCLPSTVSAADLVWKGSDNGSGLWTAENVWTNGGTDATFAPNDNVEFSQGVVDGEYTINIDANADEANAIAAGNFVVSGLGSYTFNGGTNDSLTVASFSIGTGVDVIMNAKLEIADKTLNIAAGSSLTLSGVPISANSSAANAYGIVGAGTLNIKSLVNTNDRNYFTVGAAGFTGTMNIAAEAINGSLKRVMFVMGGGNTAENRFSLNIAKAAGDMTLVISGANNTLYLQNLNGDGTFSSKYGSGARHLNIAMTESCEWGGRIDDSGSRFGDFIVNSTTDNPLTLKLNGNSEMFNATTTVQTQGLKIGNAIVELSNEVIWSRSIDIAEQGTLRLAYDSNKIRSGTGNLITGIGTLEFAMLKNTVSFTMSTSNSGFNGQSILNSGTVIIQGEHALGTSAKLTMNGGILDLGGTDRSYSLTTSQLNINSSSSKFVMNVGNTVQDSITYTGGSLTLGEKMNFDLILDKADLTAGASYTLFTSQTATLTSDMFASWIPDTRAIQGELKLGADNKTIIFDVTSLDGEVANLTWAGNTSGIWQFGGTDKNWINNSNGDIADIFYNQDNITFGADGEKNVQIVGNVSPGSMIVTADGYVFSGDGSISGSGQVEIATNGGKTTFNTENTYSGGTKLTSGSLYVGSAGALGSGQVIFNGGILAYQAGFSGDLSNKIDQTNLSATNQINLDINGNTVTWATAINWINLSNSADTIGKLIYTGATVTRSFAIDENSILQVTTTNGSSTAANNTVANGIDLSGKGTLNVANTNNSIMLIGSLTGFNGTIDNLQTTSGASIQFAASNTENDRFNLNTGNNTATAQSILIGNDNGGWATGDTLYLSSLTGNSNLSTSYGGDVVDRGLDVLMSEDNTYHGNFHSAAGNRWGTITIGGEHTFSWTGSSVNNNGGYISLGTNAKLLITNGATMEFAAKADNSGGGQWRDEIQIDANSTLLISRNDATGFVQQTGNDNQISGAGQVVITGKATLAGNNTYTGGTLVDGGDIIVSNVSGLGTGSLTVNSGSVDFNHLAIANNITISGGSLSNVDRLTGNVSINQNVNGQPSAPSNIQLGGLAGNRINQLDLGYNLQTNEVGSISGVSGAISLSNATLGVNASMVNGAGNTPSYVIDFGADGGSLTVTDTLTLAITNDLAAQMLENKSDTIIQLTSGGNITLGNNLDFILDTQYNSIKAAYELGATGNGSITLTYLGVNGYVVSANSTKTISSLDEFNLVEYKYAVIDGNWMINIDNIPAGSNGLQINGLEGGVSSALINTSGSSADLVLQLNESGSKDAVMSYSGSITGNAQIQKNDTYTQKIGGYVTTTGLNVVGGTLSIGGNLTVTQGGDVTVANGTSLILDGTNNTIAGTLTTQGSLTLSGKNSTTSVETWVQGGAVNFNNGATLLVTSNGLELTSVLNGTGALKLEQGNLTLGNGASVGSHVSLGLGKDATLQVDNNLSIGALSGEGTVNFAQDGSVIELGGATDTFDGSFTGSGTLSMIGGGKQTLGGGVGSQNVDLSIVNGELILLSGQYGNVSMGTQGIRSDASQKLSFKLQAGENIPQVELKSLTATSGEMLFETSASGVEQLQDHAFVSVEGNVSISNTKVVIDNKLSFNANEVDSFSFTLIEGGKVVDFSSNTLSVLGLQEMIYDFTMSQSGDKIIVSGSKATENKFLVAANTYHSTVGANLLDSSKLIADANKTSTLYQLSDAVARSIQSGDHATAATSMAAAVGSTLTSYGIAQNTALRDQMGWLRNRTTQMGVNQSVVNNDMPYYNMWVQGTGSYNKLNSSGDESGYSLSTWGGTVGVDVDLNERLTVGLAFSAQFGDLEAKAADRAKGDLDSYYLNGFARYQVRQWAHTLIVTGVRNDGKLSRTVDYGSGSYDAHSKTNGYGIGAMYELTYDYALNEEKTSILQPLANVSVAHTSMDGFDETGADLAGLTTGKQDMTVATLALGGRWIGVIGSNVLGRESFAEVRVNVAQDFGDDRSKVNVGFLGNSGMMQSVQGAKIGTTAAQIGAGLTMPIGEESSIFVDANADFRSGASSVNGSLGYRYNF